MVFIASLAGYLLLLSITLVSAGCTREAALLGPDRELLALIQHALRDPSDVSAVFLTPDSELALSEAVVRHFRKVGIECFQSPRPSVSNRRYEVKAKDRLRRVVVVGIRRSGFAEDGRGVFEVTYLYGPSHGKTERVRLSAKDTKFRVEVLTVLREY